MAVMLTTVDNPYDPFDDFDGWYHWDMSHQYSTCCLLARLIPEQPDSMPDSVYDAIKEQHIDEYVKLFPNYKKVTRDIDNEDEYKRIIEYEESLSKDEA